jgi:hypothetical protein
MPFWHAGLQQGLNVAAVAKRLHEGCVHQVGPTVDRARNGPVLNQK